MYTPPPLSHVWSDRRSASVQPGRRRGSPPPSAVNRSIASPGLCYCCGKSLKVRLVTADVTLATVKAVTSQNPLFRSKPASATGAICFGFQPCWRTCLFLFSGLARRFCSRHIVQGLTRICISARLACYCQEGAKHRRKESRWVSKKWTVVEIDFPCFHFGFLITLPSWNNRCKIFVNLAKGQI